jgi:hypothetical protein
VGTGFRKKIMRKSNSRTQPTQGEGDMDEGEKWTS